MLWEIQMYRKAISANISKKNLKQRRFIRGWFLAFHSTVYLTIHWKSALMKCEWWSHDENCYQRPHLI